MVSTSKLQQGYTMLSEDQDTKHIVITLSKVASKLTSQKGLMRIEEEERGKKITYIDLFLKVQTAQ